MSLPRISSLDSLRNFDTVTILDEGGELCLSMFSFLTFACDKNLRVVNSVQALAQGSAQPDTCVLLRTPNLTNSVDALARAMKAAGGERLVIAPSPDWVISRLKMYKNEFPQIIFVDNIKCTNSYCEEYVLSWDDYTKISKSNDFIFIPTRDRIISEIFLSRIDHKRFVDINTLEERELEYRGKEIYGLGYKNIFDATVLESAKHTLCGHSDMGRTARFAFQHLKPSDCAFDIGAHRGQLSAIFRMRCAKVHAFEPEPGPYADMAENLRLDSNVHLHNIAISDHSGDMSFYLDARGEYGGGSSLFSILNTPTQSIKVNVLTLEDVIKQTGDRPDFIKIDVEGAEPEVILGGIDYIKQRKPVIVFEMYQLLVEARQKEFADMLQFMSEIYDLHCLETGGNPVEYAIPGRMPPMTNVGATPKRR